MFRNQGTTNTTVTINGQCFQLEELTAEAVEKLAESKGISAFSLYHGDEEVDASELEDYAGKALRIVPVNKAA